MRRQLAASAAVALGFVPLLLGLTAGPAAAFVKAPNTPAPISLPGSAYTSASGAMTSAQWDTFLRAHPELSVSPATAGSAAAKVGSTAAGGAATAVGGFLVGTQLGTGISRTLGLPTSGDFFCDLGQAVGTAGSSCAGVGPAPVYVPNSDVQVGVPGFATSPPLSAWSPGNAQWASLSVALGALTTSMVAGQTGTFHVSGLVSLQGACTPGGYNWGPLVTVAPINDAGDAVGYRGTYNGVGGVGSYCTASGTAGTDVTVDSGKTATGLRFYDADLTHSITWWAPGAVHRPADVNPNPTRTLRNTWTCTSGPGGVASSAAFSEADGSWPPVPPAQCSSGMLASVKVEEVTNGNGSVIYTWQLPAEVGAVATQYPECANGASPCQLLLSRVSSPGSTQLVSCFEAPAACATWWTDTQQGTATGTSTATKSGTDYECTYGTHAVALTECAAYSQAFPATDAATGTLANPVTGAAPESGASPGGDSSCPPPFTWSALFNNWWAFQATKCALQDAFVPTVTQQTMTRLETEVQTKTPVVELRSIAAGLAAPTGSTLCMTLSLPITFVVGHDQPLLDSCTWSDPVSQLIRDHRPLFMAAVWIATVSPLAWWAWRQYAPGAGGPA